MRSVPHFALYGAAEWPRWLELVHHEHIPERSSRFNWEIDAHVHEALLQLLYVTHGGGEALIDGRRWALEPPSLIVVPASAVHAFKFRPDIDGHVITAAQRPLEAAAAAVGPALLQPIRQPAVLGVDVHSRHADALLPLFEAIAREAATPAGGQPGAGMSLLTALFVQVARISASGFGEGMDARSRKAMQVERFRALVDQGFRRRWPVEHYARELGVSAGQLGRICRQAIGQSPLDAINLRVLHEAQRELVYASLSVKQIAAELGFDDEAYFGRFFKKHTGLKPTEFRDKARRHLRDAGGRP